MPEKYPKRKLNYMNQNTLSLVPTSSKLRLKKKRKEKIEDHISKGLLLEQKIDPQEDRNEKWQQNGRNSGWG